MIGCLGVSMFVYVANFVHCYLAVGFMVIGVACSCGGILCLCGEWCSLVSVAVLD